MREHQTSETLQEMLSEVRIDAQAIVVDHIDPESVVSNSGDASLVFLPFTLRDERAVGPGGWTLAEYGEGLPVVAFVLAAQDIELDADPEEITPEEPAPDSENPPITDAQIPGAPGE